MRDRNPSGGLEARRGTRVFAEERRHTAVEMGMGCLLAILMAGCQSLGPVQSAGASAFEFVRPPSRALGSEATSAPAEQTETIFGEAQPIPPLAPPAYPERALAAGAGRRIVGVEIRIDADGRVADVGPTLAVISTPGPWADEFLAAVEAAVRQWRFRPATLTELERDASASTAGGVAWKTVRRENTETVRVVAFTFTAQGTVMPAQ